MGKMDDIIQRLRPILEEIYQLGQDEAAADIMAAAKRRGHAQVTAAPKAALPPANQNGQMTNIEAIAKVIREHPGQRGSAIIKLAAPLVPETDFKILQRTARTSLSRLKKRGAIVKRGTGWFVKEAQ